MTASARETEADGRPHRSSALVCLVGIDGSGKSTLAKSLAAAAEGNGARCKYVYGGFTSFTVLRPVTAIAKRVWFRADRHYENSQTKGRVLRSTPMSALYQYLALTDYVLQAIFRIRVPLALGWNVVCDRYVYDLAAGIGVLLDYPPDRTLTLLHRCLTLLPKPDLVFLLDLPEPLAYQRKDDIVSLDFLRARREIYLEMAQHHDMTVLDASFSQDHLLRSASARVLSVIGREA